MMDSRIWGKIQCVPSVESQTQGWERFICLLCATHAALAFQRCSGRASDLPLRYYPAFHFHLVAAPNLS